MVGPRKGETVWEKSQRLHTKALELRSQAAYKRVVAYLKTDPAYCTRVETDLVAAGLLADVTGQLRQLPSRGSLEMIPDGDVGDDAPATAEDGTSRANEHALRNHTTVGKKSPRELEQVLSAAEPITLSPGNLMSLRPNKSCRVACKEELLHVLEKMTGLTAEDKLAVSQRSPEGFANYVKELNLKHERLCATLRLPCDFNDESSDGGGEYVKEAVDATTVRIKFLRAGVEMEFAVPRHAETYISHNWSKMRAKLCTPNGALIDSLFAAFETAPEADPQPEDTTANAATHSMPRRGKRAAAARPELSARSCGGIAVKLRSTVPGKTLALAGGEHREGTGSTQAPAKKARINGKSGSASFGATPSSGPAASASATSQKSFKPIRKANH